MTAELGKFAALMGAVSPQGIRMAKMKVFPDDWAMGIGMSVDGHDFTYEGRPFLKDIIRDHHPERAIRKSAQMGATVISLTTSLFWWQQWNLNVMYLLPVKNGTIPFSQGRVQPMCDSTVYIKSRLRAVDNINHKRTDRANFYVRGTNVPTELQEVPIDCMIWDEFDKMHHKNMKLAKTRMDASTWKWVVMLSTPTIPGFGIDRQFQNSDKRFWFMKCPRCNFEQTLTWDDNVEVGDTYKTTVVVCQHCRKVWPHKSIIEQSESTGHWVITDPELDDIHGYQINQLFSPTRDITELARIYFDGLDDPESMRELYNSALGLPYTVEGDRLTEEILDGCADGEKMPGTAGNYAGERLYIGIDVGKVLHVTAEKRDMRTGKMIKCVAEIMRWHELIDWLESLSDFIVVIDRFPETAKATELALRFWGRVFLCTYRQHPELAEWIYPATKNDIGMVKADRTIAIDTVNNQYLRRQKVLPRNMREVGEPQRNRGFQGWYRQMMSSVRVQQPDTKGNMIAKWEQLDGPDHWHHADVYCLLAGLFATPAVPPVAEQEGEVMTGSDVGVDELDFDDFLIEGDDFDEFYLGIE